MTTTARAGSVRVDVEANVAQWNRSLDTAEKSMRDLFEQMRNGSAHRALQANSRRSAQATRRLSDETSSLRQNYAQLRRVLGRVAPFLSGAALLAGATALSRQNQELRLGAGIANIGVREYTALSRVFGEFGLDAQFVGDIVNDTSERLRDALEGQRSYADAFERIGIDLDEFADQSRVNRILSLARALETVDSDAAQLTANDLFGDQGQSLVAVLRLIGAPELARRIEETLKNVNVSDAQSLRIQTATERVDRFKQSLSDRAFLAAGSILEGIANGYSMVNDELERTSRIRQELIAIGVVGARAPGPDFIDPAGSQPSFQDILDDLNRQDRERADRQAADSRRLQNAARNLRADAFFESIEEGLREIEQFTFEPLVQIGDASGFRSSLEQALTSGGRTFGEVASESILRSFRVGLGTSDPVSQRRADIEEAFRIFGPVLTPREEGEARQRFEAARRRTEELEQQEQMVQAARIARLNILGNTFSQVINAAIHDTLEWEDVLLSTLNSFIQFGLQNLASGATFFGGARQQGGNVFPDRSYIVGERGPERFVPRGIGSIIPNMGSEERVQIFIESGVNAQGVRQIARELFPEAETRITTNIRRQMDTPGTSLNRSARRAGRY